MNVPRWRAAVVGLAGERFESRSCHMAIVQERDRNKIIIHKLKSS